MDKIRSFGLVPEFKFVIGVHRVVNYIRKMATIVKYKMLLRLARMRLLELSVGSPSVSTRSFIVKHSSHVRSAPSKDRDLYSCTVLVLYWIYHEFTIHEPGILVVGLVSRALVV